MSPEDFSNGNNSNHPEVKGLDLEVQRAEQVTLRHLLVDITNITSAGNAYESDDSRAVSLHFPNLPSVAASIRRFKHRASPDISNRLAGITHIDSVGEDDDKIITNYFILGTPDGLEVEKHSQYFNPRKELLLPGAALKTIIAKAIDDNRKIDEIEISQAEEDLLGLSFVSEQEARNLLKLLSDAVPFKRPS